MGYVVLDRTFDNGYLWRSVLKMFEVGQGEGNRQAQENRDDWD